MLPIAPTVDVLPRLASAVHVRVAINVDYPPIQIQLDSVVAVDQQGGASRVRRDSEEARELGRLVRHVYKAPRRERAGAQRGALPARAAAIRRPPHAVTREVRHVAERVQLRRLGGAASSRPIQNTADQQAGLHTIGRSSWRRRRRWRRHWRVWRRVDARAAAKDAIHPLWVVNKWIAILLERRADQIIPRCLGPTHWIRSMPRQQRRQDSHRRASHVRYLAKLEIARRGLTSVVPHSHVEHRTCKVATHTRGRLEPLRVLGSRGARLHVRWRGALRRCAVVKEAVGACRVHIPVTCV